VVEVSRDATERRLSANQATGQQRQRNFQLGDVPRVEDDPTIGLTRNQESTDAYARSRFL